MIDIIVLISLYALYASCQCAINYRLALITKAWCEENNLQMPTANEFNRLSAQLFKR